MEPHRPPTPLNREEPYILAIACAFTYMILFLSRGFSLRRRLKIAGALSLFSGLCVIFALLTQGLPFFPLALLSGLLGIGYLLSALAQFAGRRSRHEGGSSE